ncbi:MMP15 (predicted) [Pycnogonum litorale]
MKSKNRSITNDIKFNYCFSTSQWENNRHEISSPSRHRTRLLLQAFRGCASYVFILIALFISIQTAECSPSNLRSQRSINEAVAVKFLKHYGYLSDSNPFTANLRTADALRASIEEMQRFAGINETGELDPPTIRLMYSKRCGVADMAGLRDRVKRYTLQGQKWETTDVTWTVDRWKSGLDARAAKRQFKKALEIWSKHSQLKFRYINSRKADIVISFYQGNHNDGHPFDGPGNILAHAFFPGKGRDGDAHFDSHEEWVPREPKPYSEEVSLFAVAAHEFGHSLGLSHSSVPGSLMFPYYNGFKENDELPRDDIIGIQQLYGARHPKKWASLGPIYTRAPATRPKTPWRPRPSPPRRRPDDRTPARRPTRPGPTERPPPDTCNTHIDSISTIRSELFIFKDKYFWRINKENKLLTRYPIPLSQFWIGFPEHLNRIDAVYERPDDHKIVFFSGDKYWLFYNVKAQSGYPKPLTNLGLPKSVKRIDAAMIWGQNGKTYFFSGHQYWRYSEEDGRVEYDYPRNVRVWGGIPHNLDGAFQWSDGRTYFFKEHYFWLFNDKKMKVHKIGPRLLSPFWFNCPKNKSVSLPKPDEHEPRNRFRDQLHVSSSPDHLSVNIVIFVSPVTAAILLSCLSLF